LHRLRPSIPATHWSPAISAPQDLAESFVHIEPVILHAMSWAAELGIPAVGSGSGAALRLLTATARAKAVVEVGTGTGVSGLWLLRGMRTDGVLTSIDIESEHQAMARQSFAAAGFAPGRARLITGAARPILPRLADGAYDLVFVDGDIADYPHCVDAAHRLLRDDGLLIIHNALADDLAADEERLVRDLVVRLQDTPQWSATLLPAGAGLLCANKVPVAASSF
jgi:predicted O-methyltransferase YrrM